MNELQDVPLWIWIVVAVCLFLQGNLLFRDAKRRGKMAWFWGLWGITGVPTPTVVYLLFVVLPEFRRRGANGK
ncbi:hypothetical protein A8L34_26470 [Bacillus sp. FJAT-27264]|uniref:hypothetical protein n=1 Tax=Paenibacillus sp. (strain DSM 101736 / FJAT-27264) TaxID=1850362 RepID=UPI000807EC0F|nr:hypothetical protein [Bacillus sp. FJAT-27264]OBZ16229.1 hypothetical protein A8L34_26470 [Bacillus sp. FJAT-27264]